ncbi:cytochrome c3 family protein [Haliea sp. E17]|uniref:cytochrome c3 family protein n=1 Tax=Haliea sp. E17 TaxID=3401576 RepID=UPI003AAB467D
MDKVFATAIFARLTGGRFALPGLLALALLLAGGALQAQDKFAEGGSSQCLGCHDFGPESPVHPMLQSPHGAADNPRTPMANEGCEACHGPSGNHAAAPTQVSPGVSFGPRWTASTGTQDGQCLACHKDTALAHWDSAPHNRSDLACTTCHDIHHLPDKVLAADTQGQVCTVCHKVQREGIHGLSSHLDSNPACTTCHSPHDASPPLATTLENRSAGCRSCHDLVAMASAADVSDKAKSYHKVMARQDRSCLDCHQGIAHAPADSVAPMVPTAVASKTVHLFFPGQSDSEWLLGKHPGSQPLRHGASCQQCHRGEEARMGASLAGDFQPATRDVRVSVSRASGSLRVELDWQGPADDADIALLWGDDNTPTIQRAGCFAACHSDMSGMSRDRGEERGKYLLGALAQQRAIGRPALFKDADELQAMRDAGQFGELWRVQLANGSATSVQTAVLLTPPAWNSSSALSGSASYRDGRWRVSLSRPMAGGDGLKPLLQDGTYTFGIALHGKDNPGGRHWISLPQTLGFQGDDSDFRAQ